jgi:hypothetical protein
MMTALVLLVLTILLFLMFPRAVRFIVGSAFVLLATVITVSLLLGRL